MLRLLAVCGLLIISLSFDYGGYDESAYESALREHGFSEEDIELFLQEYGDASEEVDDEEEGEFVPWHVARGYYECEELKRRTCGQHGKRKCTGCLKPKLRSDICVQYECPPIVPILIADRPAPCGYEARQVLSAKWAVTLIDTSDMKTWTGRIDAFWRLFKYINKANDQGTRIAKAVYAINRWFLDDNFRIESAQMAFYIPSAFQANPPTPTDDLVTVETWDDAITYDRVFGGNRTDNPVHMMKQFKILEKVLAKENITPYPKMSMTYEYNYLTPGCGNQRNEVILVDNGSM